MFSSQGQKQATLADEQVGLGQLQHACMRAFIVGLLPQLIS